MEKYSSLKLLNKAIVFEHMANSQLKNNKKLYKTAYVQLVIGALTLLVPAISSIIQNNAITPKSLKEGIDNVISELQDLDDTFNSPYWSGLKQVLKAGGGAAAVGTGIGAGVGSMAGGAGAVPGAAIGALIGGGVGTIKGMVDWWQISKLCDKIPEYKKIFDPFKEDMIKLNQKYNDIVNISKKENDFTPENYELIKRKIDEYNKIIRKVQIKSVVISEEAQKIKTGFTEFVDTLSSYSINIFSDLKNVQDAIAKLNPEITKTMMVIDAVMEKIEEKEKEVAIKLTGNPNITNILGTKPSDNTSKKPKKEKSSISTEEIEI